MSFRAIYIRFDRNYGIVKRRLLIGLAVAALCVAAGILAVNRRHSESPPYQGKSLQAWCLQLYGSPDQRARDEAEAAMKSFGPKAVPDLIKLLQARDSVFCQRLWSVAPRLPLQLRLFVFKHVRSPQASSIRGGAARSLGIIGLEAKAAIPTLAQALRDKNRQVCWLGQVGPAADAAIPALARALKDQDEGVRASSAYSLSRMGSASLPVLLTVIEQERGPGRRAAARALTWLHPPTAAVVSALLNMLQDRDASARQQAIETLSALRAMGTNVLDAFTAALKDPASDVRLAAVKALGQLSWKAQQAVPGLTDCLSDESPVVRESSARTLGAIGAGANPAVPELIRLTRSEAESVRSAAEEALAKIGGVQP